ncbi:Uncharacterised protein [Vibrio metschnikovii]|nr:Uncharacterised protein [Vibrio metschnikovii]
MKINDDRRIANLTLVPQFLSVTTYCHITQGNMF